MQISTDGLIIREQTVGENDRLVTILTRDAGLVRAFARGAKRIKNKNASATQLLCYSRFVLYCGRDKYIVEDAQPLQVFFELRRDIESLSLAQYFCELSLSLVPEETPAGEFLRLVLNALHYLAKKEKPPLLLKSVVELRMLSLAGYMPNLICCDECGAYEVETMFFLPRHGIIRCENCGSGAEMSIALPPSVVTAMRFIIYSEFDKIFSFSLPEQGFSLLSRASEQYVLCRLERDFSTLQFFHQLSTL